MELEYTRRELPAVARDFYDRLGRGEFCVARCAECGRPSFPPREFCFSCGSSDYELAAHSGRGTLYSFTTQERGFRFTAPDVIGLVELEDGVGLGFGVIRSRYEDLSIGQPMRLDPVEAEDGWTVPAWTPEE
jgi:uncharacterized OB-fold protein